jgi:class 3 adenylate cyclase
MKTDIRGFTTRVGMLSELDLSALLKNHKQFILEMAAKHDGSIVKGEGGAFWMVFPSVTAAALAAYGIQEELRFTQVGKSDEARLAVRIVITLGDVLHHEKDIFGASVNLAARIESLTPADEIYLSHAAWLALNKTEVRASYVGEFDLKGIAEPAKIYKLDQEHRTRLIKDQIIVFTDIAGSTSFAASHPIEAVEELLLHHEMIHQQVCEQFGGTVRLFIGDGCFMTFPESQLALAAIESLFSQWEKFVSLNRIPCLLRAGIHKGDIYLFRSYLFGKDINATVQLEALSGKLPSPRKSRALVSDSVRSEITGSIWEARLLRLEWPEDISLIKEVNAMCLYEYAE